MNIGNFNQKCYIEKDFKTKEPRLEIRTSKSGKDRLVGRLMWLDGKDQEGKNRYTKFNFSVSNPELISLIQDNVDQLIEISGFLKNNNWKEGGKWHNYTEIAVVEAKIVIKEVGEYNKAKANGFQSDDMDDEIPF